jgi:Zn-finger nucleic acid-binding protein
VFKEGKHPESEHGNGWNGKRNHTFKSEEVMKGNPRESEIRVELKYCEHCGGLWVREGGAGVYCERCAPMIADLPIPKRQQRRPKLPVGRGAVVERYDAVIQQQDGMDDLEAMEGVA